MLAIFKFIGVILLGVGVMFLISCPPLAVYLLLFFGLGSFALMLMSD